jgi:hypothetical protein
MKKTVALLSICLCLTVAGYSQKLSKKDAKTILEKAWSCVKSNDTASFRKMWILDKEQWPYHTVPFTVQEIMNNFYDFKVYFDKPLAGNMKFDEVGCDTVPRNDPHAGFSKYYIVAWFKLADNTRKGFGFYMDYVGDKWLIRFSPDYVVSQNSK